MPNNQKRGEEALSKLDRELNSRDRKEKARPLGVVAASVVVILALVGGIWFMTTRDGDDEEIQAEETATGTSPEEAPEATVLAAQRENQLDETVTCTYDENGEDANGAEVPNGDDISARGTVTVNFQTNQGDIPMELDRELAPCTVNAITELADSGFYNDTICHRMTTGGLNVLQCGDPTGSGAGGPGFQFADEYPTDETDEADLQNPVTYPRGAVAMANSGPDTNGSQFFLNYADSQLAPNYTYFGTVTADGLETLDKIAEAGVEGGQPDGAPAEEVKIESAEVSA